VEKEDEEIRMRRERWKKNSRNGEKGRRKIKGRIEEEENEKDMKEEVK
jgi:hypothetical protein